MKKLMSAALALLLSTTVVVADADGGDDIDVSTPADVVDGDAAGADAQADHEVVEE